MQKSHPKVVNLRDIAGKRKKKKKKKKNHMPQDMFHVVSIQCVAHDCTLATCNVYTCWRQFAVQCGDCKKKKKNLNFAFQCNHYHYYKTVGSDTKFKICNVRGDLDGFYKTAKFRKSCPFLVWLLSSQSVQLQLSVDQLFIDLKVFSHGLLGSSLFMSVTGKILD